MVKVWTDGSCRMVDDKTPGGWGWVDNMGNEEAGAEVATTNNRMEIVAVIRSLEFHIDKDHIVVHSDSAYIVDCMVKGWWKGWKKRGWRTSGKKPVANQDLWEQLLDLCVGRKIEFVKVKAHNGNPGNTKANNLAQSASKNILRAIRDLEAYERSRR